MNDLVMADSGGETLRLDIQEQTRLGALETVIEEGKGTFVKVGNALLEIQQSRLYRQGYGTFEEYLRERWDMRPNYAYLLMQEAHVVHQLVEKGLEAPNQAQTRELVSLLAEPEKLVQVVQEVQQEAQITETPVTAAKVKAKVRAAVEPLAKEPVVDAIKANQELYAPKEEAAAKGDGLHVGQVVYKVPYLPLNYSPSSWQEVHIEKCGPQQVTLAGSNADRATFLKSGYYFADKTDALKTSAQRLRKYVQGLKDATAEAEDELKKVEALLEARPAAKAMAA